MIKKRWRELTEAQRDDIRERFSRPHVKFDGIPYVYEVENGKVKRRHLAYRLESRREMDRLARRPYSD